MPNSSHKSEQLHKHSPYELPIYKLLIKCNTTLPYISVNSGVGKYKYTLQRAQQLWRRPRACCTYVHDISRQNSKLYSIDHLIIFQSHLNEHKHTPYNLPTGDEVKKRNQQTKLPTK